MSDLADTLFSRLKAIVPEVSAELGRKGTQGASELAHALFSGSAYVPYGPGQQPAKVNEGVESPEQQAQHQNDGRGR